MVTESGAGRAAASEFVITRIFNAPRELVYDAWTKPEHLKRWWGPNGYTAPVYKVDPRPGGAIHFCMRSSEGQEMWGAGTYLEVEKPERIVCTDSFSDKDGNIHEPTEFGLPAEWPREAKIALDFSEQKGRTVLTMHLGVPEPLAESVGARQGWNESLDRLADYLEKMKGGRDAN